MTISPLAGKLLPPSALVDVPRLVTAECPIPRLRGSAWPWTPQALADPHSIALSTTRISWTLARPWAPVARALVIGLLIDESIVVLENTSRHLAMGKSAFDAARDAASEVTRPLTIVTVTISVVFFPVIFLSGTGKFLFTPLALSVIFAIVTSRLLATTLVPV